MSIHYKADYHKSGEVKCNLDSCEDPMISEQLKIGLYRDEQEENTKWFHPECFFNASKQGKLEDVSEKEMLQSTSDIKGVDDLKEEERLHIEELFKQKEGQEGEEETDVRGATAPKPEKGEKKRKRGDKLFEEKVFCISGTFSRPRKEIVADIEDLGGVVKTTITKAVNIVLVSDAHLDTEKVNKARSEGKKIVQEDWLKKKLKKAEEGTEGEGGEAAGEVDVEAKEPAAKKLKTGEAEQAEGNVSELLE